MRTYLWLGLASSTFLVVAGCDPYKVTGVYCDKNEDCESKNCLEQYHACVAADFGLDLSMCSVTPCPADGGLDGSMCESNCMDAGPDLEMPDLRPACTVATVATACTDPAAPICDTTTEAMCIACRNAGDDSQCNSHMAGKLCLTEGSNTGKCGDCRPATNTQSTNCSPSPSPVCDGTGACRKCQSHTECTSQVCTIDGSCADPSFVVYANVGSGACSDSPHTSTPAAPYCQIQKAIDNIGSAVIVRVYPSSTAYSLLTISTGGFSIVGPPATATACATSGACAKVSGDATNPAISVSGAATSVAFDGIEVTGIFAGLTGIFCSNGALGPSLTVRRSYLHGLSGVGLSATNCKVTIDRTQIGPGNSGGAIALSGAEYSISNNFVVGNATTSKPAITLDGSELSGGLGFRNNTVIKNGNLGGVGGVACNTGTMNIRDSIIWQNTTSNTGGAGTCNLVNTVVSPSPDPTFVDSAGPNYDAHLSGRTAANLACCVDQLTSSPNDHDYDGEPRPLPAAGKWDIGADEIP